MNQIIVNDALTFCPQNMQKYLLPYRKLILDGFNFSSRVKTCLSPHDAQECYEKLISDLKNGQPSEYTLKSFGLLADTILCTVYPGSICHDANHMPLIIRYDGHQDVPNIAARIRTLKAQYNNPCRDKDTKRIEALYNVALNEILDCWLAAWTQSGHAAQPYASGTVYQYNAEIK